MRGEQGEILGKRENLVPNGSVQIFCRPLLEVGPSTSSDEEGVSREGHGLGVKDVGHAAVGVTRGVEHGERKVAESAKEIISIYFSIFRYCHQLVPHVLDFISLFDQEIGLGSAGLRDDALAARQQLLEEPSPGDVVRMDVSVQDVGQV